MAIHYSVPAPFHEKLTAGRIVSVLWNWRSYRNVLYLFLTFPLGILYFTVLSTGISTGLSTIFVLIGVPVLALTAACWYGFVYIERFIFVRFLGISINPLTPPIDPNLTLWQKTLVYLRSIAVWRSVLYLFLTLPLGIMNLVVALLSTTLSLSLIALPVGYLWTIATHTILPDGLVRWDGGNIPVDGTFHADIMLLSLGGALMGVVILLIALHVINILVWGESQLGRLMLGMTNTEERLAESRAEAQRQQMRAQQAEQSRRDLILNVSHDLRTPVANIRSHVEALMLETEGQRTPAPETLQANLSIVDREARRLASLIDDLLTLARGDSGSLQMTLSPVDPGVLLNEIYTTMAPLAKNDRQITLLLAEHTPVPAIIADRERLTQVLMNLVRNAIAYTPDGGIVSLEQTQIDEGHVALTVADTGIGIPPEDLPRVFDRFYRVDASRSRATGGFGLGLSIARDLVEGMGGTIAVTSVAGEGSRFTVTFPVSR